MVSTLGVSVLLLYEKSLRDVPRASFSKNEKLRSGDCLLRTISEGQKGAQRLQHENGVCPCFGNWFLSPSFFSQRKNVRFIPISKLKITLGVAKEEV